MASFVSYCFKHIVAPIMLALSRALFGRTILPVVLKTRSRLSLIAGILNRLIAKRERRG
jgi:hypothetical protein